MPDVVERDARSHGPLLEVEYREDAHFEAHCPLVGQLVLRHAEVDGHSIARCPFGAAHEVERLPGERELPKRVRGDPAP